MSTRLLCTVAHDLLQQRLVIAEAVITLLKIGQHAGHSLSDFTFQMTIHFTFEVLLQL
ncbi:hypothetical protein D3C81_2261980 [compost metagenome]